MRALLLLTLALLPIRATAGPRGEESNTQAPPVHKGDRVQLSARVGAVTAQVEAEALEDGQEGALIRVRNLHSGRVHKGRVLRVGQVEVMN